MIEAPVQTRASGLEHLTMWSLAYLKGTLDAEIATINDEWREEDRKFAVAMEEENVEIIVVGPASYHKGDLPPQIILGGEEGLFPILTAHARASEPLEEFNITRVDVGMTLALEIWDVHFDSAVLDSRIQRLVQAVRRVLAQDQSIGGVGRAAGQLMEPTIVIDHVWEREAEGTGKTLFIQQAALTYPVKYVEHI